MQNYKNQNEKATKIHLVNFSCFLLIINKLHILKFRFRSLTFPRSGKVQSSLKVSYL